MRTRNQQERHEAIPQLRAEIAEARAELESPHFKFQRTIEAITKRIHRLEQELLDLDPKGVARQTLQELPQVEPDNYVLGVQFDPQNKPTPRRGSYFEQNL